MKAGIGESFALRYSSPLSDIPVCAPPAVAAAQLASISSCAVARSPERVPDMLLFLSSCTGLGDLNILYPLRDLVVLLLLGGSAYLHDAQVLIVSCASTADLSVMSLSLIHI